MNVKEIILAPPADGMRAFLEKYQSSWIDQICGPMNETVVFEHDFPFFAHYAMEQMFSNVTTIDKRCLYGTDLVGPHVVRWETPPNCAPRMNLIRSHDRNTLVTSRRSAWDFHWGDAPLGVYLKEAKHAIVYANVPYISFGGNESGLMTKWKEIIIVNRQDFGVVLNLILKIQPLKRINVIAGPDIPLEDGYDWSSVVLTPGVNHTLPNEYETFWKSEAFFSNLRLGFTRRFLFYGSPGCGKTSTCRILASHPNVSAHAMDLTELPNEALRELLKAAEEQAPSVVILEDLDKVWVNTSERRGVSLPFFLNAIDGLNTQNGIVLVATANRPQALDKAILRPGRFDRHVQFPLPSAELRTEYFRRTTNGALDDASLASVAKKAAGFSFAALREAYIVAAQRCFEKNRQLEVEDFLDAVRTIKKGVNGSYGNGRSLGFGAADETLAESGAMEPAS